MSATFSLELCNSIISVNLLGWLGVINLAGFSVPKRHARLERLQLFLFTAVNAIHSSEPISPTNRHYCSIVFVAVASLARGIGGEGDGHGSRAACHGSLLEI